MSLDNAEAGTRQQTRDAYWDITNGRLLLREGVDPESLRDAAAKTLAVQIFGEAESAEFEPEFFRLLTVSPERGRKLMQERTKWRVTPEQQDWLREQQREVVITELDAPEAAKTDG